MQRLIRILCVCLIGSVITVCLCLLYMKKVVDSTEIKRDTSPSSSESAEPFVDHTPQQVETNTEAGSIETAADETAADVPPAKNRSDVGIPDPLDSPEQTFDLFDAVSDERSGDNVNVSPFGFGPYPEVPVGFPFEDPWTPATAEMTVEDAQIFELIHRVHIKLWNEGKRPEGLSWENGVIYAAYPHTAYVTWADSENPEGKLERYPSYITSGTLSESAEALIDEGIIPPEVKVFEHSAVGIDPYSYLGIR